MLKQQRPVRHVRVPIVQDKGTMQGNITVSEPYRWVQLANGAWVQVPHG